MSTTRVTHYQWHPPTRENIAWHLDRFMEDYHIDPTDPGDNSFYYLYDRQMGEEGEIIEVLPGLPGRVTNYYVTHPGSMWDGSQVWILCRDALTWLAAIPTNRWYIKNDAVRHALLTNGFTCEPSTPGPNHGWFTTDCLIPWRKQITLPDGTVLQPEGTWLTLAE